MDAPLLILDWNDPWQHLGVRDWNPPQRTASGAGAVDLNTYMRALLESRIAAPPPGRPGVDLSKVSTPSPPTDSGPDIKIFIAVTEVAQQAVLVFAEAAADAAPPSVSIALGGGAAHVCQRPTEALPDAAAVTHQAMIDNGAASLSQILAQNVEPDRFMLDVVGLSQARFPYVHALLRATILGANVFCLRMKQRFQVPRPSQVVWPKDHPHTPGAPVFERPPLLPLPAHSAFPGGHSFQCAAAAVVLDSLLRVTPALIGLPHERTALRKLSYLIGLNREHAGLHYRFDTDAGWAAGHWFAERLLAVETDARLPMFGHLFERARYECKA
jgi:hypothetical protein